MAHSQREPEKRVTRRFSLDLPVVVEYLGDCKRELLGHTRDVSAKGVFMFMNSEAAEGATIEFVMTLPTEITQADAIRVRCTGTVVRVEKSAQEQGVAVAIAKYDFVREG